MVGWVEFLLYDDKKYAVSGWKKINLYGQCHGRRKNGQLIEMWFSKHNLPSECLPYICWDVGCLRNVCCFCFDFSTAAMQIFVASQSNVIFTSSWMSLLASRSCTLMTLCRFYKGAFILPNEKKTICSFILEKNVLFCLGSSSFILVDSGQYEPHLEMVKFLMQNLNQVLEEKVPMHFISSLNA